MDAKMAAAVVVLFPTALAAALPLAVLAAAATALSPGAAAALPAPSCPAEVGGVRGHLRLPGAGSSEPFCRNRAKG
ncbi:MAG: hypothetical protein HY775_07810 [Acidobacteria bacterium]|nr:hypothetical protein [Acidobacteriota bacterium]